MADIRVMNTIVPLEAEFIEKYMTKANPTHVMVYIYALALCYQKKPADNASIAAALDILESDVIKAWKYWVKTGLISISDDGTITFLSLSWDSVAPKPASPKAAKPQKNEKPAPRDIPMNEITKKIESDRALADTMKMAQFIWGKPLSQSEIKLMYSILEWYSFSNEVLLMLVEYCASDEKTKSAKYMEAVAEGWAADGITSVTAAEKVLRKKEKERSMLKKCAQMFSVGRSFSDTESEYIVRWTTNFGMSEAMIKEAYARTTLNTGKLSFQYMNKILESWHKSGITTVNALKNAEGARRPQTGAQKSSSNYDFDDIERLELERRIKKTEKGANK